MHVKRRRPDDRWVQRTRDCPWLKTIVIINDQLLFFFTNSLHRKLIAELAERSPIIIQNSSNPSSRKNLDVQLYDHMAANCTMGTIL